LQALLSENWAISLKLRFLSALSKETRCAHKSLSGDIVKVCSYCGCIYGLLHTLHCLCWYLRLTTRQRPARLGLLHFIPPFADGKALLILRLLPRYPRWATQVQPSDMWMYVFTVTGYFFVVKLIRAQRPEILDRNQPE